MRIPSLNPPHTILDPGASGSSEPPTSLLQRLDRQFPESCHWVVERISPLLRASSFHLVARVDPCWPQGEGHNVFNVRATGQRLLHT